MCCQAFKCAIEHSASRRNTIVGCLKLLGLDVHVHVRYRPMLSPSVYLTIVCRLSVCLSSVTFVRPTQAVQIFRNISMALRTLAIH